MKLEIFETHVQVTGEGGIYTVVPLQYGRDVLWFCTCPDFTRGRPSRAINPLERPCKHIRYVQGLIKSSGVLRPRKGEKCQSKNSNQHG
jgi:hypothetical protein